jgi:hypothetical protein
MLRQATTAGAARREGPPLGGAAAVRPSHRSHAAASISGLFLEIAIGERKFTQRLES